MGESVEEFIDDGKGNVKAVKTNKGTYDTDLVIMSIGFKASVEAAKGQIKLAPEGTIEVNEYFQTSDKDIYAIGDAVSQLYNPNKCQKPVMLATNAVRSGVVAGLNLVTNNTLKFKGVQGTHAINVFG
jgi:NADPH-dependent 2,4-dienoyl-CoA reductase/sulfur reductase-like enzyme